MGVVARPNGLEATRVGYAIGKRVGGAVVRNRVRRRLKVILRSLPMAPGTDIVITAYPLARDAAFEELRRDVSEALRACGAASAGSGSDEDEPLASGIARRRSGGGTPKVTGTGTGTGQGPRAGQE